jgi:predicted nucleic acid-binding protein
VSVLTLAEIRRGIELLPDSRRRHQLELWLEVDLLGSLVTANILPVTQTIGERWAVLSARAQANGFSLAIMDGLIAATAVEHRLTLATRNVKDFSGLPVALLNPWDAS